MIFICFITYFSPCSIKRLNTINSLNKNKATTRIVVEFAVLFMYYKILLFEDSHGFKSLIHRVGNRHPYFSFQWMPVTHTSQWTSDWEYYWNWNVCFNTWYFHLYWYWYATSNYNLWQTRFFLFQLINSQFFSVVYHRCAHSLGFTLRSCMFTLHGLH